MAFVTGWLCAVLIVLAGALPLAHRLRLRRRAAPGQPTLSVHVALGLATSAFGFVHTVTMLGALGTPGAVAGGALALAPGAAAFFVLMAHTGVGLQLRRPALRDRAAKRKLHATTAALIVLAVAAHVVLLRRS